MTDEELNLLNAYKRQITEIWEIAQCLDHNNPQLDGAFTGMPVERITRQLCAHNVPGFFPKNARFDHTVCIQCGKDFGPGNAGYSNCNEHAGLNGL